MRSHPVWVCGLKLSNIKVAEKKAKSHPVWVCGLKLALAAQLYGVYYVTPCMGVWIETPRNIRYGKLQGVTPCMGVWIETYLFHLAFRSSDSHTLYGCVD